ncbi:MAG: ATP-binding protein [Terriglobia bacterium]
MRYPRIVAAHRLQTWLLIVALVSMVLAGVLSVDLARNLRSVVINEANKALANAVSELEQSVRPEEQTREGLTSNQTYLDQHLRQTSYEVLRSYPDIEGGFLFNEDVIGHSFPTYTELGSTLRQPPLEHQEVLQALAESRHTGKVASRIVQDGKDLVLVAVKANSGLGLSAWSLRRIFNFSDSSELNKRMFLVGVMMASLIAIAIVLRLSFGLQHGFEVIQSGLERLRTNFDYRLPERNQELRTIVRAINTMAEARQRLEADLRREDRLRVMGRVVAGIAHEIRNPLNSIRLSTRLLAKRTQDHESSAEIFTLITSEIDRLDALLKSLLVFGADGPQKIRQQSLQPVLDRTLALIKPHAAEHNVNIQVMIPQEYEALFDGHYLQQALINLLLNAIDASGDNGVVDLSIRSDDGLVEIRVEDSGPGLNPEQQERIFEAFYTTKPSGTGLGLAVTKTLLEKMGARIQSCKGAHGAQFRVLLPTGGQS